jgi:hypothetical protein
MIIKALTGLDFFFPLHGDIIPVRIGRDGTIERRTINSSSKFGIAVGLALDQKYNMEKYNMGYSCLVTVIRTRKVYVIIPRNLPPSVTSGHGHCKKIYTGSSKVSRTWRVTILPSPIGLAASFGDTTGNMPNSVSNMIIVSEAEALKI